MSGDTFRKVAHILLVASLAAVAAALFRLADTRGVQAAQGPEGQPIMIVQDERAPGGKEAEPTIYILWPGQKKVEAYSSSRISFITYDFVSRTVTFRDATIQ